MSATSVPAVAPGTGRGQGRHSRLKRALFKMRRGEYYTGTLGPALSQAAFRCPGSRPGVPAGEEGEEGQEAAR